MKKIYLFKKCFIVSISLLVSAYYTNAQTNTFPSTGSAGIGTTTPNASSILEMVSTSQGMLVPRMTQKQRDVIAFPATGLLIYQTNNTPGFYYFDGSQWKAVVQKAKGWLLTGNAGTNPATNFIGTTDGQPLAFKVGNEKAAYIDYDLSTGNNSFGYQALNSNTAYDNSAFGYKALFANASGIANTAVGHYALINNLSHNNVAVGESALLSNTSGYSNTGIGTEVMTYNSTGAYNTALGYQSLRANTTGSLNTAVGANADVNSGAYTNSSAFGYQALITASNQVRVGNSSVNSIGGYAGWTTLPSDKRVKQNIKENVPGLAFINKLKPVTYNLDINAIEQIVKLPSVKDEEGKIIQPSAHELLSRKEKEKIVYTGFVAQDVETAAKSLNYDFSGVDAPKNDKDLYGLRYSEFVVPLVKAVQELSAQNDELKKDFLAKIIELQKQIDQLISQTPGDQFVSSSQSLKTISISSASLGQNIPNPFSNTTTINYNLPKSFASAQIIITDKSGKVLKQVNVSGSAKGSVQIDATTLSGGAYQYSLLVDGKLIDTKQMILTK
jgi:hypothetical protein